MSMLNEARAWQQLGYTPLPIRSDGSKAPWVDDWRTFIAAPATADEVEAIFARRASAEGIGLVCGSASAGLEMLELEGRAVDLWQEMRDVLNDNGFGDLWARLEAGYVERTPSGGVHWYYRVDGAARGNTKIARRLDEAGKIEVLIETRGEGGFTVVAPSGGATHATGRRWEVGRGSKEGVPTISVEERDALYAILALLDQMPAVDETETQHAAAGANLLGEIRPGDDFNARATWQEILGVRGWACVHHFKGDHYGWRRPGKDIGISATTGANDGDNLYVFSTSTEFDTEKPYSKFAAYALLEHGGDFTLAAKTLRALDYGTAPKASKPAPEPTRIITDVDVVSISPAAPQTYSRTDDGNALRLVDAHAQAVRYCPQRAEWLRWDGAKWAWDEANSIQETARELARALPASTSADLTHKKHSLNAGRIASMLKLAASDPRVVVHYAQLDAEPYELNTPGGVVDLRTGVLHPAEPYRLHTRSTTVTPKAGPCPRWHRFLADTFAGDPELTTYVQRLLGLSLIGEVLEQVMPFAFGSGANGKTTLLGVVQALVGIGEGGYSISSPSEMLLATRQERHPTEIAMLSGARISTIPELEAGQRFAEAKVKQLTGGDRISARFMGKDLFTFKPTATLWVLANNQPTVRTGGLSFWRRLALLPFLHTVPEQQRDPNLEGKLVKSEGPAILAWLIQGAVDYLADEKAKRGTGLKRPASVAAATEEYERDQDVLQRFIDDCCDLGEPGRQTYAVASSALYAAYERWARAQGEHLLLSQRALTTQLVGRFGVRSGRTASARMLDGIRLKPDTEHADQPASDWFGER